MQITNIKILRETYIHMNTFFSKFWKEFLQEALKPELALW